MRSRSTSRRTISFALAILLLGVLAFFLRPRAVFEPWIYRELDLSVPRAFPRGGDAGSLPALGGGVALFDADGDGDLDIVAALPQLEVRGRLRFFRNLGGGSFRDDTEKIGLGAPIRPYGLAAGDFDGDGLDDLYVACDGPDRLYVHEGAGLREVGRDWGLGGDARWTLAAAAGDFDADGRLDVFVTVRERPTAGPGGTPAEAAASDRLPIGLLRLQTSPGRFMTRALDAPPPPTPKQSPGPPPAAPPLDVLAVDADGDGNVDLVITRESAPPVLFLGDGQGGFSEAGQDPRGFALAALAEPGGTLFSGDLDGDGRPEIYATAAPYPLLPGLLPEKRAEPAGPHLSGFGAVLVDADNDGDLDLAALGDVARSSQDVFLERLWRPLFFLNSGGGPGREIGRYLGPAFEHEARFRGLAGGDLDGDGHIDLVAARLDGPPVVFWNKLQRRNWIRILLRPDPLHPACAAGARVELSLGGRTLWERPYRLGGWLSAGEPAVHFGLGDLNGADAVSIHWPCGKVDRHGPLAAGGVYIAREGGLLAPEEAGAPPATEGERQ